MGPYTTFLVFVLLVVLVSYLVIWILKKLAPEHPPFIDAVIWVLCVLFIAIRAIGVLGLHLP